MPIAQIACIAVSSRCFARSETRPITRAASTAKTKAPAIGGSPGKIPVAARNRASPMPPSTACDTAPARLAMCRTVTTAPSVPNNTEDKSPANRAFLRKGKSALNNMSIKFSIFFNARNNRQREYFHRVKPLPLPCAIRFHSGARPLSGAVRCHGGYGHRCPCTERGR